MNSEQTPGEAVAPAARRSAGFQLRRFALGTLAGVGIGLVIALLVARQASYDPTPDLTTAQFEAAYERWRAAAPPNYDIEVRVSGPQSATYRASIRDGQAEAAWQNDKPLTTRRTFGTWSVPGMFSTMRRDVEAVEQAEAKRGPRPLILRAKFDEKYGFPQRYRRIDNGSRRGGDAGAVTWDVTSFVVVPTDVVTKTKEDTGPRSSP